ncbi:hypothetical protein CRE_19938 [Caenorhabditis remanei]|uniref:G-protein coupled receptors family 1 profile domain-containing protein n=1 Tax=Caenorhabditis remanei TaxID=31234 RepID=E3N8E0_CAERE|nr:hypothetical protein CRE_19938 [Caenorhabditis remanei]
MPLLLLLNENELVPLNNPSLSCHTNVLDVSSSNPTSRNFFDPYNINCIEGNLTIQNNDLNLFCMIHYVLKIVGMMIIVVYLLSHYSTPSAHRIKSYFYDISCCNCLVSLLKTAFSTTAVLVFYAIEPEIRINASPIIRDKLISEESKLKEYVTQICMYFDWFGDCFSMMMIFSMALQRCLQFVSFKWNIKLFGKNGTKHSIGLCAILSFVLLVLFVAPSNMKRYYVQNIGFIDTGKPGYQLIMCILFEIINTQNWSGAIIAKMDLVILLNSANYFPEISLPLLLLISNRKIKTRISSLLQTRSPQIPRSNISVLPL